MTQIDSSFLQAVRADIDVALEKVAKKHKLVSLIAGKCKYDPQDGNFRYEVLGIAEGGVDSAALRYKQLREIHPGLPELDFTFVNDSRAYKVVGCNTTGSKIHCERDDNRVYLWAVSAVEAFAAAAAAKKKRA